MCADCPLTVEAVDKRLVPDSAEQYDRGIDVPFTSSKVCLGKFTLFLVSLIRGCELLWQGPHFVTRKGMESAHRSQPTALKEHVDTFDTHATKAASLINKLFS